MGHYFDRCINDIIIMTIIIIYMIINCVQCTKSEGRKSEKCKDLYEHNTLVKII